mmetsp:Transcript_5397/g.16355  ORF Transcript_5397/g.16355 Transcript_5397/m.16355 type:complete len:280 (-) Transcript_5397:1741-2580(-)
MRHEAVQHRVVKFALLHRQHAAVTQLHHVDGPQRRRRPPCPRLPCLRHSQAAHWHAHIAQRQAPERGQARQVGAAVGRWDVPQAGRLGGHRAAAGPHLLEAPVLRLHQLDFVLFPCARRQRHTRSRQRLYGLVVGQQLGLDGTGAHGGKQPACRGGRVQHVVVLLCAHRGEVQRRFELLQRDCPVMVGVGGSKEALHLGRGHAQAQPLHTTVQLGRRQAAIAVVVKKQEEVGGCQALVTHERADARKRGTLLEQREFVLRRQQASDLLALPFAVRAPAA